MSTFQRLQRLQDELDEMKREFAESAPEPEQPQTRQEKLLTDWKAHTRQSAIQALRVTNTVLGICVLLFLLFLLLHWLFGM